MEDLILHEEKEHRGYTCKVYFDPDPWSPDDWDTLGTIYSNSRSYNPQNHSIEEILIEDEDGKMHIDPDYIYVNIYAYEHSGIALSTSRTGQFADRWDSGLFGVMAVEKDKAKKEFGDPSVPENYEKIVKCLCSEVECWDTYYKGLVFGYIVYDENECEVDSCWGYYGLPEGADEAMEEGLGIINYRVDKQEAEEAAYKAKVEKYEAICEPFWID